MKRLTVLLAALVMVFGLSVPTNAIDYTWTTLDYPGAIETRAQGIDGGNIVGYYVDSNMMVHGFLYNLATATWTTLDYPDGGETYPYGIDGTNIVGYYWPPSGYHGFLYHGATWTTLDYPSPGAFYTDALGIDGSNIVGYYWDASGVMHGFLADPSKQIGLILGFFDQSVNNGSLIGNGPGKSAKNRLNALRNMIEATGHLIEPGSILGACQQLMDAYKKTDGKPKPPDFVAGGAASELASMIQDLRAGLGCQ
jgi:hypothetical protein